MLITSREIDIAYRRGYEVGFKAGQTHAEGLEQRERSIRDAIADADLDPRFTTPPKGGKLSGEVAGLIEYSETQAMLKGRANEPGGSGT